MKKILFVLAIIVVLIAVGIGVFFSNFYMPGTVVKTEFSDYNVEYMSKKDVIKNIVDDTLSYQYNLIGNGFDTEFKLSDVATFDTEKMVKNIENPKINTIKNVHNVDVKDFVLFDVDKISSVIKDSIDNVKSVASVDARLERVGDNYEIISEIVGNELREDAINVVVEHVINFENDINFYDLDLYKKPNVLSDNYVLNHNLEQYKKYENYELIYNFGNIQEVIDSSVVYNMIIPNYNEDGLIDKSNPFSIDEKVLDQYVSDLNAKYTTLGAARAFKTSVGKEIIISNGDYGWWLDTSKMKEDISSMILSFGAGELDAFYKQKADVYGENLDFDDTYIEISIENQHVWMYVDGELIVDSDVVTGNVKNGWDTRKGIFSLTYKTTNAVLRGPGYESPVDYWMPFDGGIGMHDASWRYSFGGDIYKTNGSHGCVNMPLEAAKTIYNNITKTTPIIVW